LDPGGYKVGPLMVCHLGKPWACYTSPVLRVSICDAICKNSTPAYKTALPAFRTVRCFAWFVTLLHARCFSLHVTLRNKTWRFIWQYIIYVNVTCW
jgi:hypothetical protein